MRRQQDFTHFAQKTLRLTEVNYGRIYFISTKRFFNTLLYTGNASTQSITGAGFQPDFTWIKRRDGTYNHYAFDAPRGAGWYIKPNQTAAQVDGSADHLTAWTSDGFDLGSTDGVNASGDTFASWNWKGGTTSGIATDGSTTITPSAYSLSPKRS